MLKHSTLQFPVIRLCQQNLSSVRPCCPSRLHGTVTTSRTTPTTQAPLTTAFRSPLDQVIDLIGVYPHRSHTNTRRHQRPFWHVDRWSVDHQRGRPIWSLIAKMQPRRDAATLEESPIAPQYGHQGLANANDVPCYCCASHLICMRVLYAHMKQ